MILALLMLLLLPLRVQAADFQGCDTCHATTLDEARYRQYLHSPFAQQQCGECHAAKEVPPPQMKSRAKERSPVRVKRKKIDWLGDSAVPGTHHGFLLPSRKIGKSLVVEQQTATGEFSRHEISVPLLSALNEVQDSGYPPIITDLQVVSVQRGIFLSATIGWRTDKLTSAQVQYGVSDLSLKSEPSTRIGRQHKVVLHKLKPDEDYRFSVMSTDLFGRIRTSEVLSFSTDKPMDGAQAFESRSPPVNPTKNDMEHQFKRVGSDYLVELSLEQPFTVYVGSNGEALKQSATEISVAARQDNESHAGLSGKAVIAMGACRKCHQDQNVATHPVNVFPKPGMIIPPEYPTLSDGRISCATCHDTHSSDYEFLGRTRTRKDLCTGCHQDML